MYDRIKIKELEKKPSPPPKPITINIKKVVEKPKSFINISVPTKQIPVYDKNEQSIINSINTGFKLDGPVYKVEEIHYPSVFKINIDTIKHELPISSVQIVKALVKDINKESIIQSVDTGFDLDNKLVLECKKPKYKTRLYKESYLGEFKTETEKQLARTNLGVYSKEEINQILQLKLDTSGFVTYIQVQSMLSELSFVDSVLKSQANYEIPNNLFKK